LLSRVWVAPKFEIICTLTVEKYLKNRVCLAARPAKLNGKIEKKKKKSTSDVSRHCKIID
jgi:hypothetical protein